MAGKKRRKPLRKRDYFFIMGFLAGLVIYLYPTLSDIWNSYRNSRMIADYSRDVQVLSKEDYSEMLREAQEYNAQNTVNTIVDAFDEETNDYVVSETYARLLNPSGNEIMGYLEIPKIHVQLPVFHGIGKDALEQGIGHIEGTSLPVGGKGTHAVLSGHRGLPNADLFTDLDQLEEGDVFYLMVLGDILAYETDQILTVLPESEEAMEAIAIDPDEDLVTLITCTPYAVNTYRLLVRGHRIPYVESEREGGNAKRWDFSDWNLRIRLLAAGGAVLLVLLILIYIIIGKKKTERTGKSNHEKD